MDKHLVDRGVWMYPLDAAGLEEAKQDALFAANDRGKYHNRHKQTMYVLQDRDGYYGPVNDVRRRALVYRTMAVVFVAEPEES